MGFDLAGANAELDLLKRKFENSEAGRLEKQMANMSEESAELKNDFFIKFQSFSAEIETLKGKLSNYEEGDETINGGDNTNYLGGQDGTAKNPALETSRDYRNKYNLEETMD